MIDPSWLLFPALLYPLWEAADVRLRDITLASPRLPAAWDGVTLLFLSDSHTVKRGRRERNLERLLDGLEVDFLIFGGDLGILPSGYAPILKAASGVTVRQDRFAIWGNSENLKRVPRKELVRLLEDEGFTVLNNARRRLERSGESLLMCGVDCPYSQKSDFEAAFGDEAEEDFSILLMHAPEGLLEIGSHRPDLILSGHTHGGQIRIPGLRAFHLHTKTTVTLDVGGFTASDMRPFWPQAPENARMVISAGIGTSTLPVRLFCPPEVVRITLVKGDSSADSHRWIESGSLPPS